MGKVNDRRIEDSANSAAIMYPYNYDTQKEIDSQEDSFKEDGSVPSTTTGLCAVQIIISCFVRYRMFHI